MPYIQDVLSESYGDILDTSNISSSFPWLFEKSQNCILSPDSDGLLCGLFMSNILKWQISGFYDGKVLVCDQNVPVEDCIFLDVDIFRPTIRSVGHHMVLYNKNEIPNNWDNYRNCLQLNNLRRYDCLHDFRIKYPLATIHFLLATVGTTLRINLKPNSICPLLFTDGTFNILFKYPENVLNWLTFLQTNLHENTLNSIFDNNNYTIIQIIRLMDDFFRQRDTISIPNERGDRLRISTTEGLPFNLPPHGNTYSLELGARERIIRFLNLIGNLTGWIYDNNFWCWEDYDLIQFTKSNFESDGLRLNGGNFTNLMQRNPFSWAITSRNNLEYTIDQNGVF